MFSSIALRPMHFLSLQTASVKVNLRYTVLLKSMRPNLEESVRRESTMIVTDSYDNVVFNSELSEITSDLSVAQDLDEVGFE